MKKISKNDGNKPLHVIHAGQIQISVWPIKEMKFPRPSHFIVQRYYKTGKFWKTSPFIPVNKIHELVGAVDELKDYLLEEKKRIKKIVDEKKENEKDDE